LRTHRILGTVCLTVAAVSLSALGAAPASAYSGADAAVNLGPNGTSSTAAASITQGVSNGDGTRAVVFTCTGLSTGDTASTTVDCTLTVNGTVAQRAPRITLPGAAAATGGASVSVPRGATVGVCSNVLSTFVVSGSLPSQKCVFAVVAPTL
jgi:hypothetical protein